MSEKKEEKNVEEVKKVEKNEEEKQDNTLQISDDVIATIAGKAASEIPGVAEMVGGFAGGISEVLSGKKNLSKGIKVETGEKDTKIDVNIIVEYGSRIPDVAFEIQKSVKKAVENMTGIKVSEVNVHIQGVKIPEEKPKAKEEEKAKKEENKETSKTTKKEDKK